MPVRFKASDIFTVLLLVGLVFALVESWDYTPRAGLIITALGVPAAVLTFWQLAADLWSRRKSAVEAAPKPIAPGQTEVEFEIPSFEEADPRSVRKWAIETWVWIIGAFIVLRLLGLQIGIPLFVAAYMRHYGAPWIASVGTAGVIAGFMYFTFERLLHIPWPEAWLINWVTAPFS